MSPPKTTMAASIMRKVLIRSVLIKIQSTKSLPKKTSAREIHRIGIWLHRNLFISKEIKRHGRFYSFARDDFLPGNKLMTIVILVDNSFKRCKHNLIGQCELWHKIAFCS